MTRNHKKIIVFAILVALLINYPWLSLFSTQGMTFGIPTLFVFLFGIWACLIFLIQHYVDTDDDATSSGKPPQTQSKPGGSDVE